MASLSRFRCVDNSRLLRVTVSRLSNAVEYSEHRVERLVLNGYLASNCLVLSASVPRLTIAKALQCNTFESRNEGGSLDLTYYLARRAGIWLNARWRTAGLTSRSWNSDSSCVCVLLPTAAGALYNLACFWHHVYDRQGVQLMMHSTHGSKTHIG